MCGFYGNPKLVSFHCQENMREAKFLKEKKKEI